MNDKLCGLYVITDRQVSLDRNMPVTDMVEQAILGGARIVQYRDKQSRPGNRLQEAGALATLCQKHNVVFLINDDVDLALTVGADGVHLGQTDLPLQSARKKLGSDKIIGITCHNDLATALTAQQHGADYVAFGRFYPSRSKPDATPASLDTLQRAARTLRIPIAAIGGITTANGPHLIRHGAHMLAVIHAVFAEADIRESAGQFARLFAQPSPPASNMV